MVRIYFQNSFVVFKFVSPRTFLGVWSGSVVIILWYIILPILAPAILLKDCPSPAAAEATSLFSFVGEALFSACSSFLAKLAEQQNENYFGCVSNKS